MPSEFLSWIISGTVVLTLAAFVLYILGMFALPSEGRPRTPTYDRFGQQVGRTENPDYHENPGA